MGSHPSAPTLEKPEPGIFKLILKLARSGADRKAHGARHEPKSRFTSPRRRPASRAMTATLGPFTEGFASWRRILGSAPPEVQLKVFSNAVEDVASFIARGLDRAIAADELVDMAISIGFDDHDRVQDVIARAFSRADSEAESGIDWEKLNDRKRERGHGGNGRASPSGEEGKIKRFAAVPYSWRNPATIPSREFLFARHYVRNNMGATIGAGGRAKTTYGLAEFVFMACGRNQMTGEQIEPLRVWYLNGEEDQDELDRRVAAICQRYGITKSDCGDRLFVQSVRDDRCELPPWSRTVARRSTGVCRSV